MSMADSMCELQVAVSAPGLYEVSDYALSWTSADPSKPAAGVCQGPVFVLHVRPSASASTAGQQAGSETSLL